MRYLLALAAGVGACTSPLTDRDLAPATAGAVAAAAPSVTSSAVVSAPSPRAPTSTDVASQARCSTSPRALGHVQDPALNEISGVAESTRNPQVLFVHNDSGDSPRFFAINRAGQLLAELVLDTVPLLIDAEDMTIGPGPGGASFIYLGDTGNNFASFGQGIPRRKAVLYRIPVPDVSAEARGQKLRLGEAFPIVLTFPNGARDVEAFFIDPLSLDLIIISKQTDGHSQVLAASPAQLAGGGGPLSLLGELQFGKAPLTGSTMPTSAAISRDGHAILVRTYSSIFWFARRGSEPIMSALRRPPRSLPSPTEAQGEAIAFVDADSGFVTISEGVGPAVYCGAVPNDLNR